MQLLRFAKFKAPYSKPGLRERIKNRIMAGDRGGRPGQWSARKAQLLSLEYKKAGGSYKGKRTKAQKSLKAWTKQKWRTNSGKPSLQTGERYLPDRAWKKLSPAQKAATNRAKRAGMKAGRQFVPNASAAKKAGAAIRRKVR